MGCVIRSRRFLRNLFAIAALFAVWITAIESIAAGEPAKANEPTTANASASNQSVAPPDQIAFNQSPSAKNSPVHDTTGRSSAAPKDAVGNLIQQLGDDRFEMREEASRKLSQMGIEIRPALDAALGDSDPEIRVRARQVLATILKEDLERRLNAFAADVNDSKHLELPGWNRYRQIVGGDLAARQFFVEMQRAEPGLFQGIEEGTTGVGVAVEDCMARNMLRSGPRNVYYGGNNFPLGSVAALFFVGSDPHVSLSDDSALQIALLSSQSSLQGIGKGSSKYKLMKRLLGAWVSRDASGNLLAHNLWIALSFELKEGLRPAVAALKQNNQMTWVRPTALMLIAKLGDKSDLPVVESCLTDTDVCAQTGALGSQIQTQVRDVALIVAIHLHGQDPKNFGFPHGDLSGMPYYNVGMMGFHDQSERNKSFKKWSDWLAKHRAGGGASLDVKKS